MTPVGPERVAFLGLGIMGSRMAANLCRSGFEVVAWNRTPERAQELAEAHGAQVAATPAEASSRAEVTITMVVDGPQVEAVLLGPDGAAEGMAPGHLTIDMSTIAPESARGIASRLQEREIGFIDAPVTGSRPKAEDGTLTIIAGGEEADIERARPLFESMGEVLVHVGPVGHGQTAKLLNNTLAAINTAGVAQAIATARRLGLDPERLLEVVAAGSGNSTALALKGRPMLDHDFDPLFKVEHMLKDVRHCLDTAAQADVPFTLADAAKPLYERAAAAGPEGRDFAAIIEIAEHDAGL
ncbi:MAG: 3-hydroxyisobutyrate dehydrogenase [Thermoleophilaceae bacterium]|jgi:3-hydroxyisobutyrate dehydrogenase-like beta-hydroxyacid dehydrogenase|nr:3-hydroxyisobutyrate dehydrogenase [Thermoleophilaceae bacterium]